MGFTGTIRGFNGRIIGYKRDIIWDYVYVYIYIYVFNDHGVWRKDMMYTVYWFKWADLGGNVHLYLKL